MGKVNYREIPMPEDKYDIKCPYTMNPQYIVVHNTANDASAENEIKYMQSNNNQVSFHIAVDDKEAVQGIPLNRNAWHASDGAYGKGNRLGIGIEICYSRSGGDRFIKAEKNAASVIADLMKKYNIGIDHVITHEMCSGYKKHCLPIDVTDLLTPTGWKNIGDVKVGDIVAQYNDGKIEFVNVEHVIEPYKSKVVKARRIEATLDHDMVMTTRENNTEKKVKWETILNRGDSIIPVGGIYETDGLPISDDYIRFLAWVQADGHYMRRKSKYTGLVHDIGIEFHFAKIRKVNRVCEILNSLGINYTYRNRTDGTYVIRIFNSKLREKTEEYLTNKMFSWKFLELSHEQRIILLNEILKADGSETNNSYFSTKEQNYDVIAALSALSNIRCYKTTTGSSTAMIFTKRHFTISGISTEKKERETIVSCVTVPSGNILIRQYGQPKVVGNCPHRTLDMGWSRFVGMILDEYDGVNHITVPSPIFKPYIIKVNTDVLNYRTGAGINYPIAGKIKRNERYTIVAEKDGWGKLKSGAGWINLKYTERV